MEYVYLGIVIFLFCLSAFDLYVGVGNDAVNFLSSAIGSKAARFRVVLAVAILGVFVGATTSSGMMDVARHGIFNPAHFMFGELMCVFLGVVATDVILLDIFNTLGMPTSTTVSMVFELLGGSTALAVSKMMHSSYTYGELINTDKALSVIMAIFLSVAIAFVFGLVVQWLSRLIFTFHYTRHLKYTIGIFGGVSITSIAYFLLVKGIGTASFMRGTEAAAWISDNTSYILIAFLVGFTILMQILHWCRVNVFRIIVLFGTFSLAMAFAGNDLVNFIGVTLAGFDSYQHFIATPGATPETFGMGFLNESATTPIYFLVIAGAIMVISLATSKKAQTVVKTSVDLSRQTPGDEMFGSSRLARSLVRGVLNTTQRVVGYVPAGVRNWVNGRFNQDETILPSGAAFDLVRASVNLVLAGLLIVVGTSLKLPLSTTYVAFMVGMGSSLADRAWGRESAVFRVTGVISVIGGWFMTAGAAFMLCFLITLLIHYGGVVAMVLLIGLVVFMLYTNNKNYNKKMAAAKKDEVYTEMMQTHDYKEMWRLLCQHMRNSQAYMTEYIADTYMQITDGLINEDVKQLRRALNSLDEEKKNWKVMRRKELYGMRHIDPMQAVEKSTWFHLANNSTEQSLYCLKRMCEPCLDHVDNNFNPMPKEYIEEFEPIREQVKEIMIGTKEMIETNNFEHAMALREKGDQLKTLLSSVRHEQQHRITYGDESTLKVQLLYLSTLQETQEIISHMRHFVRANRRFLKE